MERILSRVKFVGFFVLLGAYLGCTGVKLNSSAIIPSVQSWNQINGGLGSTSGFNPSLGISQNTMYLAYADQTTGFDTYAFSQNNFTWAPMGTPYAVTATNHVYSLGLLSNGSLYAYWTEGAPKKLYIGTFNGPGASPIWSPSASPLNITTTNDALNPTTTVLNSVPYIAWAETPSGGTTGPKLMSESQTGAGIWQTLFSGLGFSTNPLFGVSAPAIMSFNSKIYFSWSEPNLPSGPTVVTVTSDSRANLTYLAYEDSNGLVTVLSYANNGAWNYVGAPGLFQGDNVSGNLAMAVDGNGTPYVAFVSTSHLVKVINYVNSSWNLIGSPLGTNVNGGISLTIDKNNKPWLAFADGGIVKYSSFTSPSWAGATTAGTGTNPTIVTDSQTAAGLYLSYIGASNAQLVTLNTPACSTTSGVNLVSTSMASVSVANNSTDTYFSYISSAGLFYTNICSGGTWQGETTDATVTGCTNLSTAPTSDGMAAIYSRSSPTPAGISVTVFRDIQRSSSLNEDTSSTSTPTAITFNGNQVNASYITTGGALKVNGIFSGGSVWATILQPAQQIRVGVYSNPTVKMIDSQGGPLQVNGINRNKLCDATNSTSTVFNGKLYFAWIERGNSSGCISSSPRAIHAAVYNGNDNSPGGIALDSNGLNFNSSYDAQNPILFTFFGALYLSWIEANPSSPFDQTLRIKAYNGNDGAPTWHEADFNLNSFSATAIYGPAFLPFQGNLYSAWGTASATPAPGYGSINAAEGF